MDTVTLNGSCFAVKVKAGDYVKAGQLLVRANIEGIKKEGLILQHRSLLQIQQIICKDGSRGIREERRSSAELCFQIETKGRVS